MKVTAGTTVRNAVLTVVTLFGTVTIHAATSAAPRPQGTPAVEYVSTAKRAFAVNQLDSMAGKARLQELQAERPKAFRKATAQLESRGWTPTDIVLARRIATRGEGPVQPAQTFSDGDTEIVFWSWDDGDDATWEGEIYIRNYSNGGELLINGQFRTDTDNLAVIWESQVYYNRPRTSPGAGDSWTTLSRDGVLVASLAGVDMAAVNLAAASDILLVQSAAQRLQGWAICTASGCWSAAVACKFTGPGWPVCAGGACLAVMVGCALSSLL